MDAHLKFTRYVHHKNTFYKQEHVHDFCELAYYVSGHGSVSREGKHYKYKKGTIHLIHAGVPHDENNEAESKIMLLYFKMPQESVPPGIYNDPSGVILSLLRRLRLEAQENLPYKRELSDNILAQILLLLKRQLLPGPAENKNFNHIVRYMDENFQFDIDVKRIASEAFYSYDRFRHVFKEHTGYAPSEYINNKRVDLAKFLIETDPDISLTSLAEECGYSSLSKFSNSFRSSTGMTPSSYKKEMKNKKLS